MATTIRTAGWLAEKLQCGRPRVWFLVRQDLVPHLKIGGRVYFDEGAVEAWLAAGGSTEPGAWRQQVGGAA